MNLRLDLFRLLIVVPRSERFTKLGIINDPDAVAAEKPDQFGLKIDRMKDGTLQWDPEKFGYSSGVIGIQLFKNQKFDPQKWDDESSRSLTDSISNPTNINAILHLQDRLKVAHEEVITPVQATLVKAMYKKVGIGLDNIDGALGGTDTKPTIKARHLD